MIIATVEITQMGKWLMLECQHPVTSKKVLVLGGRFRTRTKLLTTCGEKWWIGEFTDAGELADKLEEHVKSHDRRQDAGGTDRAEDSGAAGGSAGPQGGESPAVVSAPADLGSYREASRGHGTGNLASVDGGDQEGSGESPGES